MELVNYFDYRFKRAEPKKVNEYPFITISRETGCDGIRVAKLLVKEFKALGAKWKYIDKDVLYVSAEKLKLDMSKINYVFEAEMKTHADEILSALSNKYYKSDKTIRKAIADVVKHFAEDGRAVLLGRGGAAITGDMKRGIHIKLVAPLSWRIDSLVKRKNRSRNEIEPFIVENDKKREKLVSYFSDKNSDDICFDLTINCAKFSKMQTVNIILNAMQEKMLI